MLELMNEALAYVENLTSFRDVLNSKTDVTHHLTLGSTTFNLACLTDQQKVYLGSMLYSRLEGAKLLKDIRLESECQQMIDTVQGSIAYYSELAETNTLIMEYKAIAKEARLELSSDERKELLQHKLSSLTEQSGLDIE